MLEKYHYFDLKSASSSLMRIMKPSNKLEIIYFCFLFLQYPVHFRHQLLEKNAWADPRS